MWTLNYIIEPLQKGFSFSIDCLILQKISKILGQIIHNLRLKRIFPFFEFLINIIPFFRLLGRYIEHRVNMLHAEIDVFPEFIMLAHHLLEI